ncbi:MFS transporter [Pandoraea vervacti]|uniref:MFS transporter n=1 Tax=Pandoraea vervacti TaxID=656178 RepID=A0ABM5SYK5_9BURK|nr:MFS transporter [Pandoraea vervacti]AJP57634.1 MFS transporter [Pandoraea vervacti]
MSPPSPSDAGTGAGDTTVGYAERNRPYWQRNLAICVFGSFTTLAGLSMLLPFLPLYVKQLGVAPESAVIQWSGVAFSATFLGTAATAPIWGHLADRFGRRPMLIRAAVGMVIVTSLIGIAHNVYQLVALRLLTGLIGGYASASTVMIGTQAPRERAGWALGVLSTGALAGNLTGPLIGGLLPPLIGIRGTFFACAGMISITALLTIFGVREAFDRARDGKRRTATNGDARMPKARAGIIAAILFTGMMVLLANMSIEPIITVYISQLGVDGPHLTRVAGVVMASSALGSMLSAAKLGALADRIGSWRVIVGCLIATALVMAPQAFVTEWWQLAALRVLMGMTLAGLLPAIGKLARHAVHERSTGKLLGYLQSAQFSGQVIGPIIGGQVAVMFGLPAVFFMTSILLILCSVLANRARIVSARLDPRPIQPT